MNSTPIMPFGKYKGLAVSLLPLDYLKWLTTNCKLRSPLKEAVAAILNPPASEPVPTPEWDNRTVS